MDISILVPILSLGCIGIFACGFYLCLCAHPNRIHRRFQRRVNQTRGTNYPSEDWNQSPSNTDHGFNNFNHNGFNRSTNIDRSVVNYPGFAIDHDFNQPPNFDHYIKPWSRPETPPPSYLEATGGYYNGNNSSQQNNDNDDRGFSYLEAMGGYYHDNNSSQQINHTDGNDDTGFGSRSGVFDAERGNLDRGDHSVADANGSGADMGFSGIVFDSGGDSVGGCGNGGGDSGGSCDNVGGDSGGGCDNGGGDSGAFESGGMD